LGLLLLRAERNAAPVCALVHPDGCQDESSPAAEALGQLPLDERLPVLAESDASVAAHPDAAVAGRQARQVAHAGK